MTSENNSIVESKVIDGRPFEEGSVSSERHQTVWIEAGPKDGPLMIFLHGWPELSLIWRHQIRFFAARGWRCIAPDMRGYGRSEVHDSLAAYAVRHLTQDMVELHDALGGKPALWVGHDWGSAVVWALASHHPERCRAVVNMCVPYFARGWAMENTLPLVDRALYPVAEYPYGQWDYCAFYRESFGKTVQHLEANVAGSIAALYSPTLLGDFGKPAITSTVRAAGGWFGPGGRAPDPAKSPETLLGVDYEAFVEAFTRTGYAGANAWYMNDAENIAYGLEAKAFGKLQLPVLFLHANGDTVCNTVHSRLADPMRTDCKNLTEVIIDSSHELTVEKPDDVNNAIETWLAGRSLFPDAPQAYRKG